MQYFYGISAGIRLALQIALLLGIAVQMILLFIHAFIRKEKNSLYYFLMEAGVLYFFLVLNLSLGLIQVTESRNLYFEPYPVLWTITLASPVLGVPVVLKENNRSASLAVICLVFSSAFMEELAGPWYTNLIFIASSILLVRSLFELRANISYIQANLSRFSMKQAFDSFPEGLAIGREHGNISIINAKMRKIMAEKGLVPDKRSSGLRKAFRRMIREDKIKNQNRYSSSFTLSNVFLKSERKKQEESKGTRDLKNERLPKGQRERTKQIVFRSFESEGKIYRYTEEPFSIAGKGYHQILLSDISQESDLIKQIQEKNNALEEYNKQLEEMLSNIEEIELDKETRRMRNRIHDVMGQRLSIIHSSLQQMDREQEVPLDDLLNLLEDMMSDLNEADQFNPLQRFENIRSTADIVGAKLIREGEIFQDKDIAAVSLQILREAVTNAIRHGQAEEIIASFAEDDAGYSLTIANNGKVPSQKLSEGEGISGMRQKLEPFAGELNISSQDVFTVHIHIPKKQEKI